MKKIKFILIGLLVLSLVISLFGCSNEDNNISENFVEKDTVTYSVKTAPTTSSEGEIISSEGVSITLPMLNETDYYYNLLTSPTCIDCGEGRYIWKTTDYGTFSFNAEIAIQPNNHNYQLTDEKVATEEENGYRVYTCSDCQTTYTKTLIYTPYDENEPTVLTFAGEGISIDNNNGYVDIIGTNVTILKGGEYSLSGNSEETTISIKASEDEEVIINLEGVNLASSAAPVIYIEEADKVEISAKKNTNNVLTDNRVLAENEDAEGGTIYSCCDLTLKGKGSLTITGNYNNGVATKKDLEIKNLTLYVKSKNHALKGNDEVKIESGCITAISTAGDGIKTTDSDISGKGKQRGNIELLGGTITVYAACDGLDAAYNVVVEEEDPDNPLSLSVFTDKYSEYSEEVTQYSENVLYVRFSSQNYCYSFLFSGNEGEPTWVNAVYDFSKTSSDMGGGMGGGPGGMGGGMSTTYYYYKAEKPEGYDYVALYIYEKNSTNQGTTDCLTNSQALTINDSYDTLALTAGRSSLSLSWTNHDTTSTGMGGWGGMDEGNTDKGDYSTKGIKADNSVIINSGTVNVTSYDDAIHANNDNALENEETPLGSVTISGGYITLASNDDAIHGDGNVTVSGGQLTITKSYEGIEGDILNISGGSVSIVASDDGINTYTKFNLTGGYIYVYAGGDGLDSNGNGIFDGATVYVISTSGGNSCLDTESGFSFKSGTVLAIAPQGSMWSEVTRYVSSGLTKTQIGSASKNQAVIVKNSSGDILAAVNLPTSMNLGAVYMSSNNTASSITIGTYSGEVDSNGVAK